MFSQFDKALARCGNVETKLSSEGYAVVDNIFDDDLLSCLRDEVEFLDNSSWLEASGNKLQQSHETSSIVIKPCVFERSIMMKGEAMAGEKTLGLVPNIAEFYYQRERLVDTLSRWANIHVEGLDQVKIACIKKGGSFMVHTDTTPQKDRVITMTLYLNSSKETYNSKDDGGQLRLYPLAQDFTPEIVDVSPVYGRAVLFSSNNLPHRVLKSRNDCRYCISFFFYGKSTLPSRNLMPTQLEKLMISKPNRFPIDILLKGKEMSFLSKIRDAYPEVLSALIHTKEYYVSIAESFSNVEDMQGGKSFDDIVTAVSTDTVKASMIHFKKMCEDMEKKIDNDMKEFVLESLKFISSTSYKVLNIN